VQQYLESHPLVSKTAPADTKDGGAGVTVLHMVPQN
jgi:dsDNA-specific endonuclease/ATPase MutS2